MTREDILRMAAEIWNSGSSFPIPSSDDILRFAALVAAPQPQPPCKTDPRAPHGFLRNESHNADRYVCECEFWEPEGKPTSQDYFFRKSAVDWEAEAGKQAMLCEEYKALLRQALEALEQARSFSEGGTQKAQIAIAALRERLKS